ncbi:aspartate kinase, partial [Lactobacillaceae bacterium KNUT 0156]|nr:aspartate kinase [Weissella cibaria]
TLEPDHLEWIDDFAIIMVVGEGMNNRIGAFSEIAAPLSDAGITLPMINQGASQISLMLGVRAEQVADAVRVIYDAVF